jgi:hypothetical protein
MVQKLELISSFLINCSIKIFSYLALLYTIDKLPFDALVRDCIPELRVTVFIEPQMSLNQW